MSTPNTGATIVGQQIKRVFQEQSFPIVAQNDCLGGAKSVATSSLLSTLINVLPFDLATVQDTGVVYQYVLTAPSTYSWEPYQQYNFVGTWSASNVYAVNNEVVDPSNNSLYACISAVGPTATQPHADAVHWILLPAATTASIQNAVPQNVIDASTMRLLPLPINYKTVFITSADGGLFRRDSTDTRSAEDGGSYCGTIIRSADFATNGVWKRDYSGPLNVLWYGADTTGASLSLTAFNNMLAAIKSGICGAGWIPEGTYTINGTITCSVTSGIGPQLLGAGRDAVTIRQTTANDVFNISGSSDVDWSVFADFTIDGNSVGLKGMTLGNSNSGTIERLRIIGCLGHALEFTGVPIGNNVAGCRISVPAAAAAGTRCIASLGGTSLRLERNYYANATANPIAVDVNGCDNVLSNGDIVEVATGYKSTGKFTLIAPWCSTVTTLVQCVSNNAYAIINARGVDITSIDTTTFGVSRQNITFFGESQGQVGGAPYLNKELTPTQITVDQNNYAPTGGENCGVWRLNSSVAVNLTGLNIGASVASALIPPGSFLTLINVGSNAITLNQESASSTAANRFNFSNSADWVLGGGMSVSLYYDGTAQRFKNITPALVKRGLVAYSASITIDASLGEIFFITVTNGTAFTINQPTSLGTDAKYLTIVIKNASGGAMGAITWNAAFKMSAWTNPANGFNRAIQFYWDGSSLRQISQSSADIPN